MTVWSAEESDIPGLVSLESACFSADERWSEQAWRDEINADDRLVLVNQGDSGRLLCAVSFRRVGDEVELFRVMTAPILRRSGQACKLLAEGFGWAREEGATRCLLEVRADNEAAIQLYTKWGFQEINRRHDYYGPGKDAIVMELGLSSDVLSNPAERDSGKEPRTREARKKADHE
jgi:ribosomal protein S18 acetylase RimI-like enzyme